MADYLTLHVIKPDGTSEIKPVKPDDLKAFQEAVGGYIEIVPRFNAFTVGGVRQSCVAFCNEDGISLGLEPNREASSLWGFGILRGNVAIVYGDPKLMAEL